MVQQAANKRPAASVLKKNPSPKRRKKFSLSSFIYFLLAQPTGDDVDTLWPTLRKFYICNHYPRNLPEKLLLDAAEVAEKKINLGPIMPFRVNENGELCFHPFLWPHMKEYLDCALKEEQTRKQQ